MEFDFQPRYNAEGQVIGFRNAAYDPPRYRYYQRGNGPIFGWTTERVEGPGGREGYASYAYRPLGPGSRSGQASAWQLDQESISHHALRKDAKARASRLYREWEATEGARRAPRNRRRTTAMATATDKKAAKPAAEAKAPKPSMTKKQAEEQMSANKDGYLAYVKARESNVARADNPHSEQYTAYKRAYAALLLHKKAAAAKAEAGGEPAKKKAAGRKKAAKPEAPEEPAEEPASSEASPLEDAEAAGTGGEAA